MVGLRNSPFNFTIRQPSPTTTSYTVSNAPARHTRLTQLLHPITILTRIVLAAVCTVYLIWESGVSTLCAALLDRATGFQINVETPWLVRWVKICTGQVSEGTSKNGLGTWAVLGICAMLLWTSSRRSHIEESLLLIRGLGLQTSTSSPSYLSTPTTRFIPMSQIQDIFIHEAFKGFEVKFYLAVIVVGEEETVVVFPKLLPKREILEEVWRGAKTVLYQNKIY